MTTYSDSEVAEPATHRAGDAAEPTRIELNGVSLRLRKYGCEAPSFKQTVLNRVLRRQYTQTTDFWIFRELDLRITHGERVGIVGPNGAGKSTLLKLIAGIYHPTHGHLHVRGRIASLINMSAGLNMELSGLENIIMRGTILGYSPAEMKERAGGILAFAGLEDYALTPMKYYSTGMCGRLAFSVATDVNPEIFLGDEIFAAGDEDFRRKAQERMTGLMDQSHIVVFVSHALPLVKKLTERVVWIDHGTIRMDGKTDEVCDAYRQSVAQKRQRGK